MLGALLLMSVLWSDTFNSAAPLTDDYTNVVTVSKVAGIGSDGSQAVRASADYSTLYRDLGSTYTSAGYVQFEENFSAARATYWMQVAIDVPDVPAHTWMISIERWHDAPESHAIYIYGGSPNNTERYSAQDFWPTSGWHDVRVEWRGSTWNGTGYDSDGYIKIYLDNVLSLDLTGLSWIHSGNDRTEPWQYIGIGPADDIDKLEIGTRAGPPQEFADDGGLLEIVVKRQPLNWPATHAAQRGYAVPYETRRFQPNDEDEDN